MKNKATYTKEDLTKSCVPLVKRLAKEGKYTQADCALIQFMFMTGTVEDIKDFNKNKKALKYFEYII